MKIAESSPGGVEKIVGKVEIAHFEQFLLFPQCFQKALTADKLKAGLVWVKVKETMMVINPFPNKPWFLCVCSTRLLKTLLEKEKLLVTSNFSFFYSVFYPFGELSAIFIEFKIVVCRLFQFGSV